MSAMATSSVIDSARALLDTRKSHPLRLLNLREIWRNL
jgi:hypothetical protein